MRDRYIIFVKTLAGDIIRAFTWVGNPDDGIRRATIEARERGIIPSRIYWERA